MNLNHSLGCQPYSILLGWVYPFSLPLREFLSSFGVTTPLIIIPVMSISCPASLRKIYFDMLKSTGFGDLVRHFSSSRQSNRVYLGWFVWYLVGRLFKLQALRQSRKARASVLLALLLALGCMCTSNCGDPYVSPGCTIFFFLLGSFFLISACLCSFPYFLLLSVLGLGSKSSSLSPEFCVQRPSKYDKICWELNPIFGFFAFSG